MNRQICRLLRPLCKSAAGCAPVQCGFRELSVSTPLHRKGVADSMRDKYFKTAIKPEQGLRGEQLWMQSPRDSHEDRFPTLETMKECFYGIPYDQIHVVYLKATKNNTHISICDHNFHQITFTTSGREGFRNARKKTVVAGQATGMGAGQRCLRRGIEVVRVIVRGIGPGRIAGVKGMAVAGVKIVSISDMTKLPELGPRPKKKRRL